MAPLTHFQTPITAKPLTRIERNQLREPQAMSGYHLGTTWGPKKNWNFYQSVRLGEKAIYRTIFPICTFLPTGLSATAKGQGVQQELCTVYTAKGQGVQQELCTVYTAKGQGVHCCRNKDDIEKLLQHTPPPLPGDS